MRQLEDPGSGLTLGRIFGGGGAEWEPGWELEEPVTRVG